MGIYRLLGRVEGNDDNARKVYACADEISRTFRISKKNALQLLLTANVPAVYGARYMPHVKRDGDEVVMRFGRKTTLADIKAVWHIVKDVQREIGSTGSKKSINPELAFCIHRQHILKGRKIADIFDDYLHKRLEGYEGKPPTLGENDFRKYFRHRQTYHRNMVSKLYSDDNSPTKTGSLVVSVQKARRILGTLAHSMNDDQVKELIYSLHLLAKEQLVYNGSKYDKQESTANVS